jgi:hypothetical protein
MAAKRHKRRKNKRDLQCSAACFYFTWRVKHSQNVTLGKSSMFLCLLCFFAASQLRFSGSSTQAEGMNVPAGFGARLAQRGDETLPVLVIQKNQLPPVPAIQHRVHPVR